MTGEDLIRRLTALEDQSQADSLLAEYATQVGGRRAALANMTYFAHNVGGRCQSNLSRFGLHVNDARNKDLP